MEFLSLAPVHSNTYPAAQQTTASASATTAAAKPSSPTSPSSTTAPATLPLDTTAEKTRRSSSMSSTSSGLNPQRFLKLGPVFYGGEPGVPDYAEEAIEE